MTRRDDATGPYTAGKAIVIINTHTKNPSSNLMTEEEKSEAFLRDYSQYMKFKKGLNQE